jgi:hypothetical protein
MEWIRRRRLEPGGDALVKGGSFWRLGVDQESAHADSFSERRHLEQCVADEGSRGK